MKAVPFHLSPCTFPDGPALTHVKQSRRNDEIGALSALQYRRARLWKWHWPSLGPSHVRTRIALKAI